jgi:alpha-mannosidase
MLESSHEGPLAPMASFADDGGGTVVVTALKVAGDAAVAGGADDLVVRAVEMGGQPGELNLTLPWLGRRVAATFSPHQIRTFRIPADPAQPWSELDLIEQES